MNGIELYGTIVFSWGMGLPFRRLCHVPEDRRCGIVLYVLMSNETLKGINFLCVFLVFSLFFSFFYLFLLCGAIKKRETVKEKCNKVK